jgi:hypothetical protein
VRSGPHRDADADGHDHTDPLEHSDSDRHAYRHSDGHTHALRRNQL